MQGNSFYLSWTDRVVVSPASPPQDHTLDGLAFRGVPKHKSACSDAHNTLSHLLVVSQTLPECAFLVASLRAGRCCAVWRNDEENVETLVTIKRIHNDTAAAAGMVHHQIIYILRSQEPVADGKGSSLHIAIKLKNELQHVSLYTVQPSNECKHMLRDKSAVEVQLYPIEH